MNTYYLKCEDKKCAEVLAMLEQDSPHEWESEGSEEQETNSCELEDPFCPWCDSEGKIVGDNINDWIDDWGEIYWEP